MQRYRSFAGYRHREIVELQYYVGMSYTDALEGTYFNKYLQMNRMLRIFGKYGTQSYFYKDLFASKTRSLMNR